MVQQRATPELSNRIIVSTNVLSADMSRITNRDVAAAQVIRNRGLVAVGQPVQEKARVAGRSGDGFTRLATNL